MRYISSLCCFPPPFLSLSLFSSQCSSSKVSWMPTMLTRTLSPEPSHPRLTRARRPARSVWRKRPRPSAGRTPLMRSSKGRGRQRRKPPSVSGFSYWVRILQPSLQLYSSCRAGQSESGKSSFVLIFPNVDCLLREIHHIEE